MPAAPLFNMLEFISVVVRITAFLWQLLVAESQ
jgi:hypothetical protein